MYKNGKKYDTHQCSTEQDDVDFSRGLIVPASASLSSILRHPQDEGKTEGYPIFERQSSFHKQSNVTCTLSNDLLKSFKERLESFQGKWPDWATVPIFDIAKAGMRYIGPEDKVQCDYCRGILYSWDDGDVPLEQHQKHFPLCSFLQERCWEILEREIQQNDIDYKKTLPDDKPNNSLEPAKLPSGNTQYLQISEPPLSKANVAIDIVKRMGYDEELIKKAINILLQDVSQPEINSSNLLDVVFCLEDSMDSMF